MHINSVNMENTAFGSLHIRPTAINKLAIEKFLAKVPEATVEFLSEIDRESGDEDVYLCASDFDSGNIDLAITDKEGNLYGVRRVGIGSPENMQRSLEKFTHSFTRKTLMPKPKMPDENENVNKILDQYV